MNEIMIAAILGVVEGVTEYLPISSTGHLIIAGHMLGFTGPRADTFEIFIQLGAILAVVWLYLRRLLTCGLEGYLKLGVATLPALAFGFVLHHFIKEHLFSTQVVAVSLIVGGVVLMLFPDKGSARLRSVDEFSFKHCFYIGLFQVLALCPGVSRSGATIVGAMVLGASRSAAAEFSFLLAVPTLCAAVGYDLLKSMSLLSSSDVPLFSVGFTVSFIVALIAIKSFISFLTRSTLKPFGLYRILLGAFILWYF